MSDQNPQYQPPAGGGNQPPGEPEQTRRFDAPYGEPGPTGYHDPAQTQPAWSPGPGSQPQNPPSDPPFGSPRAGQPWIAGQPRAGVGESTKGFFSALFDFNFDTFITPKIIKVVYIVIMALVGLFAVGSLITALISGEPGAILLALIGIPLMSIVYLALARMTLELYFAVIRLSEDVHDRMPRQ